MALIDSFRRAADSDIWYSFRNSPMTMVAAAVTVFIIAASFLAPLIALQNPFDPANLNLSDAMHPPILFGGEWSFPMGSDDQGRDLYSAILYGTRLSLEVGFAVVFVSMILGIGAGLVAGYVGGTVDAVIMRIADVQLTFPAILIALLVDGVVKAVLGGQLDEITTLSVLVFSIGLSFWVQYARTVRDRKSVVDGTRV